jgi:hypothetical protein
VAGVAIAVALVGLLWLITGVMWLVRQWELGLAVGAFHILAQANVRPADG